MARKTVFQQLNDLFGPDVNRQQSKSRYSINDKELLKTKSKEEYDYEKLKRQQDAYLANQWKRLIMKSTNTLYIMKPQDWHLMQILRVWSFSLKLRQL